MKKKYLLVVLLIIFIAGLYLNRAYSHIYSKINQASLESPDHSQTYLINNNIKSNKNLIYTALGDSLTAGVGVDSYNESYPFLLAQKMSSTDIRVTLKDRSIPGAKTEDIKNQLLDAVIEDQPDIITILAGINDIHGNIGAAEFQKNYKTILKRLTEETKAKIYLINIPFLGAPDLLLPPYTFYFDYQTNYFNSIIRDLARAYQVKYIDLCSPASAEFKKSGSHYSSDLFHPSAQGYASWAQIIYDGFNK